MKSMYSRIIARLLLPGLVVGMAVGIDLYGASEANGKPKEATTRWTEIEGEIGAASLDGTLRFSDTLGTSRELGQLGLRLEIEHKVETDAWGRARSRWVVKGLQSYLVPSGRERLRWQAPSGGAQWFDRKKIGRALSNAGPNRWLIRQLATERYEIRSSDGQVYCYDRGRLVRIEHPMFGSLEVATQGTWITRIEQSDAPPEKAVLLQADYSEAGNLLTLQIGDQKVQRLTWSEAGDLSAWAHSDGRQTHYKYEAHLLSDISESERPSHVVRWAENPGYGRGDSRWAAPVHLRSWGPESYDYEITQHGFVLSRRKEDGQKIVTVFNPRRFRLEQNANGQRFVVKFRSQTQGRGALERIETGEGKILEEYQYDNTGRLLSVKKEGKPVMNFDYDDSGRLISVEGKETS